MQMAYSAEEAAAFAYIGHAGSLKNEEVKRADNHESEKYYDKKPLKASKCSYYL